MQTITIKNRSGDELFNGLASTLDSRIEENWGESRVVFNNNKGKGIIRQIAFDWGVSLIDFELTLNDELKIIYELNSTLPVEFMFITKGYLDFIENGNGNRVTLNRFQNIIISPRHGAKKTYIFPKGQQVMLNIIRIDKRKYAQKKNNNLTYIHELLASVFEDIKSEHSFHHIGNFNLKIADEVNKLHNTNSSGASHTLSLEGRLYLILAMQLLEHHRFEDQVLLPDSLSQQDILKIHHLSGFITNNISDPLTITTLSEVSGLSPKKLQLGFQVLYSKTVNEYVRQHKLEIARDLLEHATDLTISEIVYRIGFRSRSYFSKIFSETYGILPTAYRKKLRKQD